MSSALLCAIVLAHAAGLLAWGVRLALAWGLIEGGPNWQWHVPVGISLSWLVFAVALVAAWKAVRSTAAPRAHFIGAIASALALPSWVIDVHRLCLRECSIVSEGIVDPLVLVILVPSALVVATSTALLVYFTARTWGLLATPQSAVKVV